MNRHRKTQEYGLLAVDFLLTDTFELKLMEFQNAPKSEVIPKNCNKEFRKGSRQWACEMGKKMVKDIVDIAIELAWKKVRNEPIVSLPKASYIHPILTHF